MPLTIIFDETGVQANKIFTVGEAPIVSKVEVGDLKDSNNNTIESIEAGTSAKGAYLEYKAYDQYGVQVEDPTVLNNAGKGVTVVIPDGNLVKGTTGADDAFVSSVIGTDAPDLLLTAKANAEAKDVVITLFANGTGQSVTKTIKIAQPKVPTSIEFGAYTDTLAKGDTDKFIPLVVKNEKGEVLSTQEIVDNKDAFTIYATGGVVTLGTPVIQETGADKGKVKIASVDNKGTATIVVQLKDKPNVKAQINVSANDARYADRIAVSSAAADKAIQTATTKVKFKTYDQLGGDWANAVTGATYATGDYTSQVVLKMEKISR